MLEAVCYADVFDWPLTPAEVHRYLPVAAPVSAVVTALRSPRLRSKLDQGDGLVALAGRGDLFRSRRLRGAESERQMPRAVRAARAVAALPFVRFVAISGSLAVGASAQRSDVDLFVVTEDRRLWITRALSIGVVRVGAAAGLDLCPNYFLAESALEIPDRDLFTAHELVQLVPIAGAATYEALLARNAWVRDFLPNATPRSVPAEPRGMPVTALAERLLRAAVIDRIERWEMGRKVARFTAGEASEELRFTETACKGHFEGHRLRALDAYHGRVARFA